ncbi:MAG: cupin domain-containing protein [Deltaproteobacteria bacterium]|nr:cupin domain-containing protein [Deltaproteobacteria bacterium]
MAKDARADKAPEEVSREGAILNIFQGAEFKAYGGHMRFVCWPGMGAREVGTHCVILQPGEAFAPHVHAISCDVVLVFRGQGQFFLGDRWYDVQEGDLLYAPPGVMHGTRNPATNSEPMICVGTGVPPQLELYEKGGYLQNGRFTYTPSDKR